MLFSKLLLSVGTFFARFRQVHHQVLQLKYHNIQAACLTKETPPATKTAIARGQYSVVFASPEALARSGRALLATDVYRQNLCGIFVDESQCIKQWLVDLLKCLGLQFENLISVSKSLESLCTNSSAF